VYLSNGWLEIKGYGKIRIKCRSITKKRILNIAFYEG
jgi:hypothetical protein